MSYIGTEKSYKLYSVGFILFHDRETKYLSLFWHIYLFLYTCAVSNDPTYLQSSNLKTCCLRPYLHRLSFFVCAPLSSNNNNEQLFLDQVLHCYKCMLKLLLTTRKKRMNAFYLHQFCSMFQIVGSFLFEDSSFFCNLEADLKA